MSSVWQIRWTDGQVRYLRNANVQSGPTDWHEVPNLQERKSEANLRRFDPYGLAALEKPLSAIRSR